MAKTTPKISVIERRLQGPSAFRSAQAPIPLMDAKRWSVRWVTVDEQRHDRLYEIQHVKGWVYAEPADIACSVEEIGARVDSGRIVRGTRGQEVLMKMPAKDFARIQRAKEEEARRQTFGLKQIKQSIVDGAAEEHGERAAEFIHDSVRGLTVTDTRGPEDAA